MSIIIENVNKHFGSFHALQDVNLTIPTGELVALLGPSGCGKTTLLNLVAGFFSADGGKIMIDGELMNDVPTRTSTVRGPATENSA